MCLWILSPPRYLVTLWKAVLNEFWKLVVFLFPRPLCNGITISLSPSEKYCCPGENVFRDPLTRTSLRVKYIIFLGGKGASKQKNKPSGSFWNCLTMGWPQLASEICFFLFFLCQCSIAQQGAGPALPSWEATSRRIFRLKLLTQLEAGQIKGKTCTRQPSFMIDWVALPF